MDKSFAKFAVIYWIKEGALAILGGILLGGVAYGLHLWLGRWAANVFFIMIFAVVGGGLAVLFFLPMLFLFLNWRILPGAVKRKQAVAAELNTVPPDRVKVWSAISELYLDTELDAADIARICGWLAESPYGLDELDSMYRHDVAPAVFFNLYFVAGEWAAFGDDWLVEQILGDRRLALWRFPPLKHLRRWLAIWPTGSEWKKIVQKVQELRGASAQHARA